jgi:uncharacterized membrane protein YeaQ/YmgE (transglycosylase-associated protein family)
MEIIAWIVLGALAGWLASLIMDTSHQQGAIVNIVVGVLGAIIGGFIVSAVGGEGLTGFTIYSLLVATFGAVVLLAIYRAFATH